MNTISRQTIVEVCTDLGFDAADVVEIRIVPDEFTVITFDRDADGHKFLGPDKMRDGYVKTTHTLLIVNDEEQTA